jgi:hypothetical protein
MDGWIDGWCPFSFIALVWAMPLQFPQELALQHPPAASYTLKPSPSHINTYLLHHLLFHLVLRLATE